jgi:uncharacterized membrane protein
MAPVLAGELHSFVLHFAVGLLLASSFCDVLGLLLRREQLLIAGKWMTIFGALSAAASVATGLWAQNTLGAHSAAGEALLHLHQALGFILAGLWAPLALWRSLARPALPLRLRTIYLAGAFAGAVLVVAETGLGTSIVYQHGLGLSPAARAEPVVPAH